MQHRGATIQLLDLPGIIEGASQGKGRGRQVIAVARTSDLVIIMLDATKSELHRPLLEKELESVGIRLNKKKPNIYFKEKKAGGVAFNATCALTKLDEKLVQLILHEYSKFLIMSILMTYHHSIRNFQCGSFDPRGCYS